MMTTEQTHNSLDAASVISAYKRWADIYDIVFGGVSAFGRKRAVEAVNALPGKKVLEVGVGTGLSLPSYGADKAITGIDLSGDMLAKARNRVQQKGLCNIESLLEMDAEATSFDDDSFDIAVAMFVASVAPHPKQLLAELKRVVKPGGHILFVNHFQAYTGLRHVIEKIMSKASRTLGWHPDFALDALLSNQDIIKATITPVHPFGLFTLVTLPQ